MSSPSPQASSNQRAAVPAAKGADGLSRPSSVRITVIVQNQYTFHTEVATGRQMKERAEVPPGFALYRRGGNEPIPNDAEVEVHTGDHFLARPSSSAS